jgi:hypothetical protein
MVYGGGSSAPISGVGGMSPAERVQYIQEIQRTSPLSRISEAVKNITLDSFGLAKGLFTQKDAWLGSMRDTYQRLTNKQGINQHIPGLTENVRGTERVKHELNPQENVDLPDGLNLEKSKGLFVDSSWSPKLKGKIE